MSIVDIAIVIIIVVSLLMGLFRGFIREALSLFSWLAALWFAYHYAAIGAQYLEPYVTQPPLRIVGAFAGIFVAALIAFSIVSYLLYRLFSVAGISGVDRTLGIVFGLARGVLLVSILILAAIFTDFATQPWWQDSLLVGYFEPINDFIRSLLPEEIAKYVEPKIA